MTFIPKLGFEDTLEEEEEQIVSKEIEVPKEVEGNVNKTVDNFLSDFLDILNSKEFKKYKVVIDWKKAKLIPNISEWWITVKKTIPNTTKWWITVKKTIPNTPELWITVKFDSTWEVKKYSPTDKINSFKFLKETKKHWISRKK